MCPSKNQSNVTVQETELIPPMLSLKNASTERGNELEKLTFFSLPFFGWISLRKILKHVSEDAFLVEFPKQISGRRAEIVSSQKSELPIKATHRCH